jgi:hypothetical protein
MDVVDPPLRFRTCGGAIIHRASCNKPWIPLLARPET